MSTVKELIFLASTKTFFSRELAGGLLCGGGFIGGAGFTNGPMSVFGSRGEREGGIGESFCKLFFLLSLSTPKFTHAFVFCTVISLHTF